MNTKPVYIAEIESIFPKRYDSQYLADKLYPAERYGKKHNQLAKKLAYKTGIKQRSSVLDLETYPKISLADPQDHPKIWGKKIVEQLTNNIAKSEIGHFNLGYNISTHTDLLPNLATQIAIDTKLTNIEQAEECAYYGCAASIYCIEQAAKYCQTTDKPAIVFIFDQCFALSVQLPQDDPDFQEMLITNLIFADAGVGLLLIPESLKHHYQTPLLKITAIQTKYIQGDLIQMKAGKFLMRRNLKDIMPKLVADNLVKPFLAENQLNTDDIDEWSIHQGGTELLKAFQNCLNLSAEKIAPSLQLFHQYGNLSAASCLVVLAYFLKQHQQTKHQTTGLMLGFGAGYYLGALLYEVAYPNA
ncbi:3-oxoacyl-[acyl-carrier-protein] synthase III C-terminal domain-containing protein [Candidatus Albibeggiatoa sp. nov. NOAA]|uniref:3-oxoacyl-[acyl-carrier-protein] synthase III C-terminal domain-containing protein n=1 Tax=Candidatus Albibeggiatoa sp. nov. NOAA TaxID=3162724 RepID=UPI0032FACAC2|nr:hypothetical protein [Thiotrichaceae bacterium]